ncbi:peptidylprolyl isomerase [Pseudomonas vancouverensis]|nr:peptidylprolyl isomerase [Pseudomonas vancouverensis]SDV07195.1 peptidyl-prolyl cis-trans isomerase A (cyclophilin A) [Pseudomonas vancouverensis]
MSAVAYVTLETALGCFTVQLQGDRAPLTSANFLAYVDSGRYDNSSFFRIVNPSIQGSNGADGISVIVGGTRPLAASNLPKIALESTLHTGLQHRHGTLSLGREDEADSGEGEFFVCIGDHPQLDHGGSRHEDGLGFAAFGQVCAGMEVVEAIWGSAGLQEYLSAESEVRILRAYRVAGGV